MINCLFVVFSFSCFFSFAQINNQQVISSVGTSYSNNEYIIESAIGENVINTIENSNMLTQSFHLTSHKITSISELSLIKLKLYPNPIIGFFK